MASLAEGVNPVSEPPSCALLMRRNSPVLIDPMSVGACSVVARPFDDNQHTPRLSNVGRRRVMLRGHKRDGGPV